MQYYIFPPKTGPENPKTHTDLIFGLKSPKTFPARFGNDERMRMFGSLAGLLDVEEKDSPRVQHCPGSL